MAKRMCKQYFFYQNAFMAVKYDCPTRTSPFYLINTSGIHFLSGSGISQLLVELLLPEIKGGYLALAPKRTPKMVV